MTSPGLHPLGLPVEITANSRLARVRDSEGAEGWSITRCWSVAARSHYHEDEGRVRALYESGRSNQRGSARRQAGRRAQVKSVRQAGATVTGNASLAGSNSSGCGASMRMRR